MPRFELCIDTAELPVADLPAFADDLCGATFTNVVPIESLDYRFSPDDVTVRFDASLSDIRAYGDALGFDADELFTAVD